MVSVKENHALPDTGTARKHMVLIGGTQKQNPKPQIERYPSVRTICLRGEEQKVYITTKMPLRKELRGGVTFWHFYYKIVLKFPDFDVLRTFSDKRKR